MAFRQLVDPRFFCHGHAGDMRAARQHLRSCWGFEKVDQPQRKQLDGDERITEVDSPKRCGDGMQSTTCGWQNRLNQSYDSPNTMIGVSGLKSSWTTSVPRWNGR